MGTKTKKEKALGGIWSSDLYLTKVTPEITTNIVTDKSSKAVELPGSKPRQGFINWLAFKDYLSKNYNRNTAKVRLCYAKRFYHVLLEEDAKDLLAIESEQKRLNIMKSLTLLSRYLGYYDKWQEIRKRHNLKWTAGNQSLHAM